MGQDIFHSGRDTLQISSFVKDKAHMLLKLAVSACGPRQCYYETVV